jgi:hypothetical protein
MRDFIPARFGRSRVIFQQKTSEPSTVSTTVAFEMTKDCLETIEKMVRPERFELPTFWFVARRSIQLS